MNPLEPLIALLGSGSAGQARPVSWRLSWSSWERSSVGVRDRVRAGAHAPLGIVRGWGLDYLFQWEDGRLSTGAAERVGIEDPERFLRLAREAAYEDPDGANFAAPAPIPAVPLHADDVAAEARSGGARSFASLLEIAAGKASTWGFGTWSGSTTASRSERGVLTSAGARFRSESTYAGYSFWYEGLTGDGHAKRTLVPIEEVDARLERACDLVRRLGSPERSFTPGTMPVLLHPPVVDAMLGAFVLSNLHGSRIYHRQGAFRIEQFGSADRVFAPGLSLRLEPTVPMDVGSYAFTDEGVPARAVAYIDDGRLVEPILDLKYARRLGREAVPGPASSESLRLAGARMRDADEAIRATEHGLLVLSLLGLHTQDATRGDFSVSAPQSLAIVGGALGDGVRAVLTGNLFEILRDPSTSLVRFEGFRTPGLLYAGGVGTAPSAA